jgi:hypothetical protein
MTRRKIASLCATFFLSPYALHAQTNMQAAWDAVLEPSSVMKQPRENKHPAADFLNHFFFESRTEYWRYSSGFTGLPTATGVINAPFTGIFNPNGIPYQQAFQPDANRIYSFLDWGTRGWLSDRINTHFSFSYSQDLSTVEAGAPAENLIETFPHNRSLQLLNASVEINSRPTDGIWAGTSLEVGRQYVYGAELAAIDGGSFSIDRRRFSLTVFGGRRFSLFTDPDQRALGGANLIFKLGHNASLEYDTLWYIKGSHRVVYRKRFGNRWLFNSSLRAVGGSPVDFGTQAIYSSANGRTTARLNFFQKLTNKDFSYDYTIGARDRDPHNLAAALYFGPITQYSQFVIDVRSSIVARLRVGGALWIRRLNDSSDQDAFNTSFQDYRASAQVFPARKLEALFEYHQHDSDRLSPLNPTGFDDVSHSGETSVKDLTGDIRRAFREGRFGLNGGAYYRRINLQDRFFIINGMHQSGWLAGGWCRIDPRTRAFADYNLDNDFFIFRPDLKNSRMLRLGLTWKY